jgi:hypothetical protein
MKRFLLSLSAIISMGLCAAAQTTPDEVDIETNEVELQMITPAEPVQESKEEIKEREKRLRELNDDVAHAKAANSIRRGYFVLVADYIEIGRVGYRRYDISDNTNFVLVQAEDGIIQYAFNTASPGSNGLGGWTGSGHVRNKRSNFKDNGEVYFQYQLIGSHVNATVQITLFKNSNYAMARITGGPEITIYGNILPYRDKDHR